MEWGNIGDVIGGIWGEQRLDIKTCTGSPFDVKL